MSTSTLPATMTLSPMNCFVRERCDNASSVATATRSWLPKQTIDDMQMISSYSRWSDNAHTPSLSQNLEARYMEYYFPMGEEIFPNAVSQQNKWCLEGLYHNVLSSCATANVNSFIEAIKFEIESKDIIANRECFYRLLAQWQAETILSSDPIIDILSKSYQRIIGMGEKALPFIFAELAKQEANWFWALEAITGEDPVLAEHLNDYNKITEDWLCWGREHGYNC